MHDGRFKSRNRVDDALTIAMVEVGVALRAFDAERIEGRVGLRLSAKGEGFEGRVSPLPDGTIVVADEKRPLGILFDRTAEAGASSEGPAGCWWWRSVCVECPISPWRRLCGWRAAPCGRRLIDARACVSAT